ncbi:scarecrow-like protein 14 [Panicum virgatum]|uniref:scarecrow-like protein 14 n=1 Tax=Panicum virgatum TaxID=38727 RepID=UPI0019D56D8D|nr:scarecrow-like protein 14 [Panicum virgatum]
MEAAGAQHRVRISSTDLLNMAFLRGREEASKLLPRDDRLVISPEPHHMEITGRASKLMAMAAPADDEMVARMTASDCELPKEEMEHLRAAMADEAAARDVVDDDRRGARELLRQVKQHASPTGDATQRLAHCLAAALEARLAGAGTGTLREGGLHVRQPNHPPRRRREPPAARRGLRPPPGAPVAGPAAAAGGQGCGPPEVIITFVDLPQLGFRPASRIEETGRSLSAYARGIGVPFKSHAVAAARWDAIGADQLGIAVDDPGAVVVVNSLFKLETLADDSVVVDGGPSPRDRVLASIRGMRPSVFTHGVVNGFAGNSFPTRFRKALFYFSAVFDVLEATMPRASERRRVLERDVLGPCALNVVACEGRHRTDRFDSYRQWQLRSRRAGLRQLPLDREVVGEVRDEVGKHGYHRDFVISEDHGWLLQGWKGRILYAHANWVADDDDDASRP